MNWAIAQNAAVFIVLASVWLNGFGAKDIRFVRALVVLVAAIWVQSLLDRQFQQEDVYAITKSPYSMNVESVWARFLAIRQPSEQDVEVFAWLRRLGGDAGRVYRLAGSEGVRCQWCMTETDKKDLHAMVFVNYAFYKGAQTLLRLAIDFFAFALAGALSIHSARWFDMQCLLLTVPVANALVKFVMTGVELSFLGRVSRHSNLLIAAAMLVYLEATKWAEERVDAPENVLARANAVMAFNLKKFGAIQMISAIKGRDAELAEREQKYWAEQAALSARIWAQVDRKFPPTDEEVRLAESAIASFTSRDGSQVGYSLDGADYATTRRILRLPSRRP